MQSLVQVIQYLNLALFLVLAVASARLWRARGGRAELWGALTFAALGVVVLIGQLLPDQPETAVELVLQRLDIAVLVLFPFLLYRFTAAFEPPARRLERLVGFVTAAVVAWTLALPDIPQPGESRPAWFIAYLVAFLVHWTLLSVVVSVRLWRAGRGQPSVARRRMQLLAIASAALTVALFVAATGPGEGSALELAVALLATLSALAFLLGLSPPALLRMAWRRPEQERLQQAVADLMGATSEEEVSERVLQPMASMVGAQAIALCDGDDTVIGSYAAPPEDRAPLARGEHCPPSGEPSVLRLSFSGGSLAIWTSPYAPFFGDEELRLLEALAGLTGLALEHSRLFAREREARRALEQADELKTNFVALAAHELRTPVTGIDGLLQTLHARAAQLSPEQREQIETVLRQQSTRMRLLVEQLLDLSRLDAAAVPISPQPLELRQRVEELARATAGEANENVEVDVPADLVAMVDPNALDRIVSNLVGNALRYGEGPVTVRAEQSDRHLRLTVEDRGAGVPPEFAPQLFERFARSNESRARSSGTGLGLAIARSYAQAHGGDLLYEPAEPHGARFQLVLPAERAAA